MNIGGSSCRRVMKGLFDFMNRYEAISDTAVDPSHVFGYEARTLRRRFPHNVSIIFNRGRLIAISDKFPDFHIYIKPFALPTTLDLSMCAYISACVCMYVCTCALKNNG